MSESTPAVAAALAPPLVELGAYATHIAAMDHVLVVLASGCECWLVPDTGCERLMVAPADAPSLAAQLARFDRECAHWPPPPIERPRSPQRVHLTGPLLWALVTMAAYWAETRWPRLVGWGEVDSQAMVRGHEWWRATTALLLHADTAHLVSNLLGGLFVFSLVASTFGRLRGWAVLWLASVLGNLGAVWLRHDPDYRSIGASTAVFAGVGLLTGAALRRVVLARGRRWRALFTPFAAGVSILALYGAGGVHVDVGAHLSGFVVGLLTGYAGGRPSAAPSGLLPGTSASGEIPG